MDRKIAFEWFKVCLCQETAQYLDKGFKLEGVTNGLLMRISHVGFALPSGTLNDSLLKCLQH